MANDASANTRLNDDALDNNDSIWLVLDHHVDDNLNGNMFTLATEKGHIKFSLKHLFVWINISIFIIFLLPMWLIMIDNWWQNTNTNQKFFTAIFRGYPPLNNEKSKNNKKVLEKIDLIQKSIIQSNATHFEYTPSKTTVAK